MGVEGVRTVDEVEPVEVDGEQTVLFRVLSICSLRTATSRARKWLTPGSRGQSLGIF